ncbi:MULTISPECIES: acetyltransferase [unclassified Psychrobacter]|uniref:acetyltransferase n=1 Tax=unclassified Psychrobacter TaxID=196806 RepID=UPI0025B2FC36|nr:MULTISPECIES: acetyltransferase [unclassified Psychrobacter]MDN3454374.1 acetyltransferase [Psychrobacter sp. APC 3350]MDN3502052.1 acetyltransferase [Psychrobacter sp. 5A.1]
MSKPLVVIGSGGHASVIADILLSEGRTVVAAVSPDEIKDNNPLKGIKRLMTDVSLLDTYSPEEVDLVNGLGSLPDNTLRTNLFDYFSNYGYKFQSVIAPSAIIAGGVRLEGGVQVMHGAIIQTNASIGKNCIINSGSVVEHDCIIGAHNHIAPNATLSGGVVTGDQVHIGTGANIIQGITIGQRAVIGAGCTIIKDVKEGQVIVPARNRIIREEW